MTVPAINGPAVNGPAKSRPAESEPRARLLAAAIEYLQARGISELSVVFPDPVAPTSAIVVPAGTSRSIPRSAGYMLPANRSVTSCSST